MSKELLGRVALVTGSSHGIGRAIAFELAQAGADIIICGRDKGRLEETNLAIETFGVSCRYHKLDVTRPEEIKRIFSHLEELDILVNNVGGPVKFGGLEVEDEVWLETFKLNVLSTVNFSRLAIPLLKKSSQPRIVNISSISSVRPGVFNPHYGACKSGVDYLTKYLSREFAKDGILVNAIRSSTLRGGGWEYNILDRANRDRITPLEAEMLMLEEESRKTPLGWIGDPFDVARLVAFLASDKARFLTGHCYNVDGGSLPTVD